MNRVVGLSVCGGRDADGAGGLIGIPLNIARIESLAVQEPHQFVSELIPTDPRNNQAPRTHLVGMPGEVRRGATGPSLVGKHVPEQFAQADFPILPPNCVTYCRRVTSVWCIFFFVNAAVSLHSAFFWPKHYWALYNGLISYILVGLIFAIEYICRRAMVPHFQAALAAMNAVDEA